MAYGSADKKLSKTQETEIVKKLNDYFIQALDDIAWRESREEMIQCFDYKENRQWTKAELAELAERGQPATVNNQVKVTVDRIVGQFVQMKSRTTYKPRNQKQDTDAANVMSDIYQYIRQSSGLEYEERDVVEDGATGGFGAFEVIIDDSEEDPTGQDVIVRAEDCFSVYPDPRSRRYDWNEDARYICRAKWVDKDYLQDLYPKKKAKIEGLFTDGAIAQLANVDALRGEAYVDYKRDRVRLVEVQYKKFEEVTKYVFSDGKVMDEDEATDKMLKYAKEAGITWETKTEREEHICVGVFAADILFEHGESKRKRFSFVPYFTNRKKSGAPYSMITTAIPLQDAINKRESKSIALLTLNQTLAEKGAIQDLKGWQIQNAKPDGILEVEEGFFEKVKIDKNLELAQSQNIMHQQSKQDFRLVTGVNPDALGEKSEVRSGVGIQRKVAMTGLVIAPIFDNFKRTREALAKTIHDAVCVAYTPDKVLTITDNPKLTRTIKLSNEDIEAVKQAKYDVIITEEQDFDTIQEQQLDIITRTLPQILPLGKAWAEVIIEMSSLRDKEAILEKVKQISQADAPKKEHTISFSAALDKVTPIEKAFLYQEMGMPPQMIQAVLQNSPPPTQILDIQASQAGEQAKMQAEQQKAQTEAIANQHKMQLEQKKAESAQVKAQMDVQKAQLDMQVAQEKAKADLASTQLKGQVEQQKANASMQQMALQSQVAEKQASMDMQAQKMDMSHQKVMQSHEQKMAKMEGAERGKQGNSRKSR